MTYKNRKLATFLRQLAADPTSVAANSKWGICSVVFWHGFSKTAQRNLDRLMRRWPEYSGYPDYPVPHPVLSPGVAFWRSNNLWDKHTQYGKARIRLALWLADQVDVE